MEEHNSQLLIHGVIAEVGASLQLSDFPTNQACRNVDGPFQSGRLGPNGDMAFGLRRPAILRIASGDTT